MNYGQYNEFEDIFNTAMDYVHDKCMIERGKRILKDYDRVNAIAFIQETIQRYKSEINQLGLFNGIYVISGIDYSKLSDEQIKNQVFYIIGKIPLYAFVREGEKDIADWLMGRNTD